MSNLKKSAQSQTLFYLSCLYSTKDPEDKLTKWSRDRRSTEERVQSNDGKDDSRIWEKNRCIEWEIARGF